MSGRLRLGSFRMISSAYESASRGGDVLRDIQQRLPAAVLEIIFDVGANIGQSTERFNACFPGAMIWSFEPASEYYTQLSNRFFNTTSIRCERLAVGAIEGEVELALTTWPTMNHIAAQSAKLPSPIAIKGLEKVAMTTLDKYCSRHKIPRIDFLKIDTEGFDLEVLRGATSLISQGLISFIQCECSVSPDNLYHCSLETVQRFLEQMGHRLFGFYDQAEDWTTGAPNLRRVNAVFISPDIMRQGRLAPSSAEPVTAQH
jgi:FkbM family methyltransferase